MKTIKGKTHISPFYYAQFSLINSKIKVVTLINLVSILRQKQWRGALFCWGIKLSESE